MWSNPSKFLFILLYSLKHLQELFILIGCLYVLLRPLRLLTYTTILIDEGFVIIVGMLTGLTCLRVHLVQTKRVTTLELKHILRVSFISDYWWWFRFFFLLIFIHVTRWELHVQLLSLFYKFNRHMLPWLFFESAPLPGTLFGSCL